MLFRALLLLTAVICLTTNLFANDYEDAWKALHKNDRKTAKDLLQKAMRESSTSADAFLTYVFLQTFEGRDAQVNNFGTLAYSKLKDVNPYIYSLWFNGAVLGDYGKKRVSHQLDLVKKLLEDPSTNGSIKAAAHYFLATHYLYSSDFRNAQNHWQKVESVGPNWQLAGPFDNLSGSGFSKMYGPIDHPEAGAKFTSANNATITWFTPSIPNKEGWTFPYAHIRTNTAIVYAQCFVNSPADMNVVLQAGGSGSLKVWVNDQQVLAESKERVTEMDYYSNGVKLKKGYNRLLVQLGYSDNGFPNFIIRLTDENRNSIKGLTYTSENQPYQKVLETTSTQSRQHFAEAFFERKIKEEAGNFLNYILLSQAYLRNQKVAEARKVILDALESFPNNSLLRYQLIQCLLKDGNNTLILQEVERMKETDPECLLTYSVNIARLQQEQKYDEALEELNKAVSIFGEDPQTITTRIQLLGSQNKMDELVKKLQEGFKKYPEDLTLVKMMFNLSKNLNKDAKGAARVYENYLKNNYNYDIITALAVEYNEQGQSEKALNLYQDLKEKFPYDPEQYLNVARFYYDKQNYKKALEYTKQALSQAPFVAAYWESLGLEQQQMQDNLTAIESFKKAIYYDANNYGAREQLRELQKKPVVWKAFPETDPYTLIKNSAGTNYEHNFYYLLDEKSTVIYPEGSTEMYVTTVVKILNEKGIDDWKHMSLPYNPNQQTLIVEKAEVVKKNGNKMKAEQDGGDVVFTGLEAGDAVVIRYKIQYYSQGRLAKEFWDRYNFNAFVPVETTRYSLLVAKNIPIQYKLLNGTIAPTISTYDDFNLYTWTLKDAPLIKEEAIMAPTNDIALSLHLSTVKSWDNIVAWYRDLSAIKTDEDFEVKQVFNELFPKGTGSLTDTEKAKAIYSYITRNIRYSSVSFRQSAYVPQKPAVTINARLGDCKDLSALFVALGKLAGLKADLVLVDTRDNGLREMELPSVEFNHCIVKTQLQGKDYFLELTDNDLPFASLPYNLYKAAYLVISADTVGAKLQYLSAANKTRDKIKRNIDITIDDSDIKLNVKAFKTGALTSSMRSEFGTLSNEKQRESLEKTLSNGFKNPLKLTSVTFRGLDKFGDTVSYDYSYKVSNEVSEVGSMSMIKIPFGDVIASLDKFSADERQYPVEYWRYEDTDEYETVITVHAPAGKQFIEIPKNESCSFNGSTYSLQFVKKSPSELLITRKAALARENIQPADYASMKSFFNKIVKAESKYIVFK